MYVPNVEIKNSFGKHISNHGVVNNINVGANIGVNMCV